MVRGENPLTNSTKCSILIDEETRRTSARKESKGMDEIIELQADARLVTARNNLREAQKRLNDMVIEARWKPVLGRSTHSKEPRISGTMGGGRGHQL